MYPSLYIGDFELPLYGLLAVAGMIMAVCSAVYLSPKCGLPRQDIVFSSVYVMIGVIVGAKILYFITVLPNIIKHSYLIFENPWAVLIYGFSGFVFYGGLIGGAIGMIIYCKQFHVALGPVMNVAAPSIPLMHAFGRIGCFLGGCCYGIEYHGPFAVNFPANESAENINAFPRFPVQLVEALVEFLIFILLFFLVKKNKLKEGQGIGLYLTIYPIARFIFEFLRGDENRGFLWIFSTSQWISLLLLPLGIYLTFRHLKEKQHKENEELS